MDKLIRSEIGGFRKGRSYNFAMYGTFPFASIKVYPGKIILTYVFFFKDEFSISDVEYAERFGFFLGSGVRIAHKKKHISPFILFWSFSPKKLLDAIRLAGFTIK